MFHRIRSLLAAAAAGLAILATPAAHAQQVFEGDTRLACEALLCLAAPQRPGECIKAITRYFSISFTNPFKTLTARLNFLQLCPAGDPSFVTALAGGAGVCTAAALNSSNIVQNGDTEPRISDVMPANCTVFFGHPWLSAQNPAPRFLGDRWFEAVDYPAALAAWEAAQAAQAAQPPAPEGGA